MEQDLKRRPDESQDQYFYRLCKMKDMLGFTWPQMTELFNDEFGSSCGESKYRKDWAAFDRIFTANEDKILGDGKYLEEVKEEREKLKKERYKLQATKIESDRLLRQESRFELFYENIRDVFSALTPPEQILVKNNKQHSRNKAYVMAIADIHAGAKFEIDGNKYSLEECKNRFENLLNQIIVYIIENNVRQIHIVELSDTIQGILRVSDVKLNETTVMVAVVTVARLIANFLNEISAYCDVEYYHTPHSNHSQIRPIGTKASELAAEDLEYVISHYIKDVLVHNSRVNVHLNDFQDEIWINVFNYNIVALHGHTIKNINNALKDLSVKHNKLIDYIIMGHLHSGQNITGNARYGYDTEVLVCPSFQGTDPYAFNKLGYSSKAACKMFIFDEQYGCTGTEKFILN